MMDEADIEVLLMAALLGRGHENNSVVDVETFEDAGLIDPQAGPRDYFEPYYGVVVAMEDGEVFQLTIVQEKVARPDEGEEEAPILGESE